VPKQPRKANKVGTVQLTIRTTPTVISYLDQLVQKGMYGKNASQVAEQLLREVLRRIYGDQAIAGPPPAGDQ
jgi:hypothetical protein